MNVGECFRFGCTASDNVHQARSRLRNIPIQEHKEGEQMMAKTIAKVKVNPGKTEYFKQAVAELALETRAEAGCLFYELYQMLEDETIFFFVEEWESESNLQAHLKTLHVADFIKKIKMEDVEAGAAEPFRWKRVV